MLLQQQVAHLLLKVIDELQQRMLLQILLNLDPCSGLRLCLCRRISEINPRCLLATGSISRGNRSATILVWGKCLRAIARYTLDKSMQMIRTAFFPCSFSR